MFEEKRLSMKTFGLCALTLGAWFGSGCGGRAVMIEGAGGSDVVAGGGASFGGGPAGRGGSVAQGGCSSGCVNIGCGPTLISMAVPGACCPVCVPNPACGPCALPRCASGFHAEVLDGQCCPVCALDPITPSCAMGQASYASYSQQVIAKAQSLPCMIDADCTVVTLINACSPQCQPVAALSSVSESLVNALGQAAAMDCGTCLPPPDIACGTPPPACLGGQCTISDTLPK